MCAGLWFSEM